MPNDSALSPPPASRPAPAAAPATTSAPATPPAKDSAPATRPATDSAPASPAAKDSAPAIPPASELGVGRPTKRRPGAAVGGLPVADPRPVLENGAVLGARCTACRYPIAQRGLPWCPVCYAPVAPERFAASGAVWSSTVIAIPVGTLQPSFGLAYLDLDDGPRILVRLAEPATVPIGTRLTITGTDGGNLVAAEEGS